MSVYDNTAAQTDAGHGTAGKEARCTCGQLIAKLQDGGIELKCKRCKRIVMIPFASIEGWTAPSPPVGTAGRDSTGQTHKAAIAQS